METKPAKNIYQKLLNIQQHIIGLGKDKPAYGYKYVTGDKVLEHIKPLMNEQGLLLKQEVLSIENVRQDYQTKSGTTSEILTTLRMKFTWVDAETGQTDENLFSANGQNGWDKGVGSALTYGERYFLLKYFHIATDEDDIDNPERKPEETPSAAPKPQAKATPAPAADKAPASLNPATNQQKSDLADLLKHPAIPKDKASATMLKINQLDEVRIQEAIKWAKGLVAEFQTKHAA